MRLTAPIASVPAYRKVRGPPDLLRARRHQDGSSPKSCCGRVVEPNAVLQQQDALPTLAADGGSRLVWAHPLTSRPARSRKRSAALSGPAAGCCRVDHLDRGRDVEGAASRVAVTLGPTRRRGWCRQRGWSQPCAERSIERREAGEETPARRCRAKVAYGSRVAMELLRGRRAGQRNSSRIGLCRPAIGLRKMAGIGRENYGRRGESRQFEVIPYLIA
jgi:hypothetical protein